MFASKCEICGITRTYCGSSDGILNMKNFLVGHDVLRDYLHLFLTGNRQGVHCLLYVWKSCISYLIMLTFYSCYLICFLALLLDTLKINTIVWFAVVESKKE